jgi:predicted GNAT family acetyltransferase
MPSLLDDPEAYAYAEQVAEDRRRKLTNQQALNAILQGVGDLPYTLLGAPVEISTGLLRAGGMAQGEQVGGIDYIKRKATEFGIRPPDSDNPTMRDMRMGAEIVSGAIDPTRVARAGGAVAGAVAREAKPVIGNALESYMVKSGLAPRVVPEGGAQGGLLGQTSKSLSDIENKFKDVSLDLYEKNNTINLSRIVVPKDIRNSGVGTDVMQDLVSYADQTGQKVALTPSSDFGGNVKKLKEFYKRFGFVENKGKNKDFTTRESMIRPAKEQEMSGAQGGLLDTDYRGSHSAPNAEVYGGTLDDLSKIMPADVYSSKGINLYGLGDRQVDAEWYRAAYKAKGNPDAEIEVYRAVPKGVKDINSGDWVTTSKTYADQHGERTLDGDYEIIKRKVKARTLSSEGYPYEFGYNE